MVRLLVVLAAWCALAGPAALIVARCLSYSSRRDGEFVRAARKAVEADRARRTAS